MEIMKFVLKTRPLTEKDLSRQVPFLPEDDEYEMYVRALSEDIKQLDGVISATLQNSSIHIETEESLSVGELKKLIKPLLTGTIMQNLAFDSLEQLHVR